MRFVLDNNLPPKLARVLQGMDVDVVHIRDLYEGRGDIPDVEWMMSLAKRGDVAITFDRKILAKPHERQALELSGLTIIFIAKGLQDFGIFEQVGLLVRAWPALELAAKNARRGTSWFKLTVNGRVVPYEK